MEQALRRGWLSAAFVSFFVGFFWLGLFLQWNYTTWWFDNLLHFFGGFWVASLFFYISFNYWNLSAIQEKFWLGMLLILGLVSLVGVFWEFAEFISDSFFLEKLQFGVVDTLSDLLMDLVGALFLFIFRFINKILYN